jgi:hypothetical protein
VFSQAFVGLDVFCGPDVLETMVPKAYCNHDRLRCFCSTVFGLVPEGSLTNVCPGALCIHVYTFLLSQVL